MKVNTFEKNIIVVKIKSMPTNYSNTYIVLLQSLMHMLKFYVSVKAPLSI